MKNIVCLGYAKCGTTLLDSVFRQSTLVGTPTDRKELKFFLPANFPTRDAYGRYLALFTANGGAEDFHATFEASPPYCHQREEVFQLVLRNIAQTLPDPMLVICFRHPVVRAYSHYIHNLHTFALYGEGVFAPRADLIRKGSPMSFERALSETKRLRTRYSDYLDMAYRLFGQDRVATFFLEHDVSRLDQWVNRLFGQEIADEVRPLTQFPPPVLTRRPVPNYAIDGDAVVAFGSMEGEYVRYPDLSEAVQVRLLKARSEWTLALEQDENAEMLARYFTDDLRRCAALTGDVRFLDYITEPPERQSSDICDVDLLESLHTAQRAVP